MNPDTSNVRQDFGNVDQLILLNRSFRSSGLSTTQAAAVPDVAELLGHLKQDDPFLDVPMRALGLSVRAFKVLREHDIHLIRDLRSLSDKVLLNWAKFGRKCLWEIKRAILDRIGWSPTLGALRKQEIRVSNARTDGELSARVDAKTEEDDKIVARMTLGDVVSGDGGFATSYAMAKVFNSELCGVALLIAVLFAEKMSPYDVMRRAGCNSSEFLSELAKLQRAGVFSDWD